MALFLLQASLSSAPPMVGGASSYPYEERVEEKAAANEIDKAVSWLKLTAGHAMLITKEKLTSAKDELVMVAKDLRKGEVTTAARVDSALAKAAHALGEWHYCKSKESWGKSETPDATCN